MIRLLALGILLNAATWASALDQSDTGNYAVLHQDGRLTDFTFFVSQNQGRWNIQQRQTDGNWIDVTCPNGCLLEESHPADLARIFPQNILQESLPTCLHNQAFAFCRRDSLLAPGEREYILVALMMPRPIQIQLKHLEYGWKDPLGRIQPDTDERKAQNGFGGWLLITDDNEWQAKWQTGPQVVPHFNLVRNVNKGQPLYALTFFSNPMRSDKGEADISCDIDLRRPDGSASYAQHDAACFKGSLRDHPEYLYLSAPIIKFIGEQNDPYGEWQVNITLKDNIGHTTLPLKTSFILQ